LLSVISAFDKIAKDRLVSFLDGVEGSAMNSISKFPVASVSVVLEVISGFHNCRIDK
jgi:hypothetical protein